MFFFFNDTATTEIYTLSLHDALPILSASFKSNFEDCSAGAMPKRKPVRTEAASVLSREVGRSEEHTSELQSRQYLVCRLLLEKKKRRFFGWLIDGTWPSLSPLNHASG